MNDLAVSSSLHRIAALTTVTLRQRVRKALMRGWLRLCRSALRKDRFVPYC